MTLLRAQITLRTVPSDGRSFWDRRRAASVSALKLNALFGLNAIDSTTLMAAQK
jgi:hypothetical protein